MALGKPFPCHGSEVAEYIGSGLADSMEFGSTRSRSGEFSFCNRIMEVEEDRIPSSPPMTEMKVEEATPVSETDEPNQVAEPETTSSSFEQKEILRVLEVVERDSVAIAQSFTSLFASLRSSLSQVSGQSVEHMHCFNDASGHLQECVLDAATKGNRYINSCLRLNDDVKGIESLAMQLKVLRRNVDALDSAANKILFLP